MSFRIGQRVRVTAVLNGRNSEFHGECGECGEAVPEPSTDGGVPGLIPVLLDKDGATGVAMYFTAAQLEAV